jgi:hypothetical protein
MPTTESRTGVFFLEVGIVFVITLAVMALYAWRLGGGMFSNQNYLYAAIAVAVVVAVVRVMMFNERKTGRSFV